MEIKIFGVNSITLILGFLNRGIQKEIYSTETMYYLT